MYGDRGLFMGIVAVIIVAFAVLAGIFVYIVARASSNSRASPLVPGPGNDPSNDLDPKDALLRHMQTVYDAEDLVFRDRWDQVIFVEQVLSENDQAIVVHEAEAHTQRNGWAEGRHQYHPTLDVAVDSLRFSKPIVYARVYETIMPDITKHFGFLPSWGVVYELYVIKTVPNMQDMQERIEQFQDDGLFSFVIPLNSPSEYEGGDIVIDQSVVPPFEAGTALVYCGQRRHFTRPVTQGVRYALYGLVHKLHRRTRLPIQQSTTTV